MYPCVFLLANWSHVTAEMKASNWIAWTAGSAESAGAARDAAGHAIQ